MGRRGRRARFAGAIALAITAGALSGCYTTAGYDQRVAAYVGTHVDAVLLRWGPPDKLAELSDGRRILEYSRAISYQTGGYTTYRTETVSTKRKGKVRVVSVPVYIPLETHHSECVTRFVIERDGRTSSYSFAGNGCRAPEIEPTAWASLGRMLLRGSTSPAAGAWLGNDGAGDPSHARARPDANTVIRWSEEPVDKPTLTPPGPCPENRDDPDPNSADRSR